MDVLSFHVTASILALGFDVGLVFPSGGWLTEGGREKESLKKKETGREKEVGDREPHPSSVPPERSTRMQRKSLFIAITNTRIANPASCLSY